VDVHTARKGIKASLEANPLPKSLLESSQIPYRIPISDTAFDSQMSSAFGSNFGDFGFKPFQADGLS
jgi:hypothetical protein